MSQRLGIASSVERRSVCDRAARAALSGLVLFAAACSGPVSEGSGSQSDDAQVETTATPMVLAEIDAGDRRFEILEVAPGEFLYLAEAPFGSSPFNGVRVESMSPLEFYTRYGSSPAPKALYAAEERYWANESTSPHEEASATTSAPLSEPIAKTSQKLSPDEFESRYCDGVDSCNLNQTGNAEFSARTHAVSFAVNAESGQLRFVVQRRRVVRFETIADRSVPEGFVYEGVAIARNLAKRRFRVRVRDADQSLWHLALDWRDWR